MLRILFVIIVLVTPSCDAAFKGGGFAGGGGGKSSDDRNPQNPDDPNSGDPGQNPDNNPSIDPETGEIIGGSGGDRLNFLDMRVIGKRLDGNGNGSDTDHTNVQVRFLVKASSNGGWTAYQTWPKKDAVVTLEKVCPPQGGTVNLVVQVRDDRNSPLLINPSTLTTVGGPIGYKIDGKNILFGYEREGVNNSEEISYHNNDDAVMQFSCPDGSGSVKIENLCMDQRIPGNGADLFTDDETYYNDDFGRVCSPI